MINDRTPNLDLPLPHEDNDLVLDVARLRQALLLIDAEFAALRQAIDGQVPAAAPDAGV